MTSIRADGGLTVPDSFRVNEGGGGRVISVQRSMIRVEHPLGRSRCFSVQEAARLIVSSPKGRSFENILLNAQGEVLCRFARTEANGSVFFQYLSDQGVPFFTPDGQPLDPLPSAEPASGPRFTLQLRRTAPVGMWIGLGTGLGMVLFLAGIPVTAMLGGPHVGRNLCVVLVMLLLSIVSPWVCAAASGQLFPPMLTLAEERLWLSRGLGWRELHLEDMDCCRFQPSDECYVLYDRRGRPILKFSTRDDFGPQLMDFLHRHAIKFCSDP